MNRIVTSGICSCGREHKCNIKHIVVERGAAERLPDILKEYKRIILVADGNTYRAAGDRVERYVSAKIKERVIFPGERVLIPDETAVSTVESALSDCDFILGIGSGVIQDLCKFVSNEKKIPYGVFATAPSMDGYASGGAAMISNGMKVTYNAGLPIAILADTEVLKDAPLDMIRAGYGDIIGKYSALNDWKLSALLFDEYFCPHIYDATMDTLIRTLPINAKLLERDEESVGILMRALIDVGVAMSYAGSSRPASGSEHHLSHYFEITGIVKGREYLPHGIDVLYSTYLTAKIREKLLQSPFPSTGYVMSESEYHQQMKRIYGEVADGCIALQNKLKKYSTNRMGIYLEKEREAREILGGHPSSDTIGDIIASIGLDVSDFVDFYTEDVLADGIRYAKDLKDRYTVLWLYYDLYGTDKVI